MRPSSWSIWAMSISIQSCVLLRLTHGGKAHVKMEADTRGMQPQVKEAWGHRGLEKAMNGSSPRDADDTLVLEFYLIEL